MKIDKFNNFGILEGLKSTIIKRLQKEVYTENKYDYKERKYVDETKTKVTQAFNRLRDYYNVEKIDDTYFTQITKEQASKKPYNNDYWVYGFYKGRCMGMFHGTSVHAERYRRKGEPEYSRKSFIDQCDEFWAFDKDKADKEIKRYDVGKDRREARSGSITDYNKSGYSGKNQRELYNDDIKKSNINRYYQAKSKVLDFSDLYDMLQLKLKKAYKALSHNIEDAKQNPDKSKYSLEFEKEDPAILAILKYDYEKSAGSNIENIRKALKVIQGFMVDFHNIKEKGINVHDYGGSDAKNKEIISKLKNIQTMLRQSLEEKSE